MTFKLGLAQGRHPQEGDGLRLVDAWLDRAVA